MDLNIFHSTHILARKSGTYLFSFGTLSVFRILTKNTHWIRGSYKGGEFIMVTFTAIIMLGHSHRFHQGIAQVDYSLYLSENSRAAWMLKKENLFNEEANKEKVITWIPTPDNMLQDALLMFGLYVYQDEQLIQQAEWVFNRSIDQIREIYIIEKAKLFPLYERAKELGEGSKLVITVLEGSTILKQLGVLSEYKMEIEVVKTVYSRHFNEWDEQIVESGDLN